MVAVEEEAEASADDRTHAHVRRRRGGGGGGVVMQASEPAECGVRSARCDGSTRRWCWITGPSAGCGQLPRPGMVEAYQRRTQSRLRGVTDGGKEGGGGDGKERARKSETMWPPKRASARHFTGNARKRKREEKEETASFCALPTTADGSRRPGE
ncbi:hypothetical protein L1887_58625 [Cichorium endivia]|nr:hypothetical protein L1887_58625 [Cichorium endivia]